MSYTMQDFQRDYTKSHLKDLTPKERLEGLSTAELAEVLMTLPTNKLLEAFKDLPAEQIEKYLEQREKCTAKRKRKRKPRT